MKKSALILLAVIVCLFTAQSAQAAFITFDLDPFVGSPADAQVKVDDNTAGAFRVNVKVIPEINTGNIGDITGVFFELSPLVTLSNITSVLGGPIIGFGNNTSNLGGGVNLSGGGSNNPGAFDVGLRYAGFSTDDIQEVEFLIDRTDSDLNLLTLDDFIGFALRIQTAGVPGGDRSGSSKLAGFDFVYHENEIPHTPEPSSLFFVATGLLGLVLKRKHS